MADHKRIDEVTGTVTSGHEWDGIEELDTPMPRWWLYILYATIVFAIGYCIAYPSWPLLTTATRGTLGWSSKGQLDAEMAADRARKASTLAASIIIDRDPRHINPPPMASSNARINSSVPVTLCAPLSP